MTRDESTTWKQRTREQIAEGIKGKNGDAFGIKVEIDRPRYPLYLSRTGNMLSLLLKNDKGVGVLVELPLSIHDTGWLKRNDFGSLARILIKHRKNSKPRKEIVVDFATHQDVLAKPNRKHNVERLRTETNRRRELKAKKPFDATSNLPEPAAKEIALAFEEVKPVIFKHIKIVEEKSTNSACSGFKKKIKMVETEL